MMTSHFIKMNAPGLRGFFGDKHGFFYSCCKHVRVGWITILDLSGMVIV